MEFNFYPITMAQGRANVEECIENGYYLAIALNGVSRRQAQGMQLPSPNMLLNGHILQNNNTGEFYEVLENSRGTMIISNLYDDKDAPLLVHNEVYGNYSVLMQPDPSTAKAEKKDKPQTKTSPKPHDAKTVWVLPKGNAPTCYVPRKVAFEIYGGELLGTVTPNIYDRLIDAMNKRKSLPKGISVYIYRKDDVFSNKPNV